MRGITSIRYCCGQPPSPARRIASALVFAILSMLFSGCTIATFENPIEPLEEATVPTELFGLYEQVNAPHFLASNTLRIEPADSGAPKGVFRYTTEEQPLDKTEKKISRGYCIATRFDESYVVQVPIFAEEGNTSDRGKIERESWGNARIKGYIFLLARIDTDEMQLALLDSPYLTRAIEQGTLQGSVKRSAGTPRETQKQAEAEREITPEPQVESITVTAEPKTLRLFFRENLDRGLFSDTDNPRFKRKK